MPLTKFSTERHLLWWTKFLYFFSNFVLAAVAVGVMYLTIRARIDVAGDLHLLHRYERLNVDLMLGASVVLFLIASIGLFSVIRSSLDGYLTSMVTILVFLLATVMYTVAKVVLSNYTARGPLYDRMRTELSRYIVEKKHLKPIDDLQISLSCCGVRNFMDFTGPLPSSCCKGSPECDRDNEFLQTGGCFPALRNMIIYYAWTIIIGLALLSIIEIVAMASSWSLYRAIREKRARKLHDALVKIPRVQGAPEPPEEPQVITEQPKTEEPGTEEPKTEEETKTEEPKAEEPKDTETKCNAATRNCLIINFYCGNS